MRLLNRKWQTILTGLAVLVGIGACASNDKANGDKNNKERSLVQTYCGSCHMPVYPDMLDSITWTDHVLPAMALKLGIGVWNKKNYFDRANGKQNGGISFEEWLKLVEYYQQTAPKHLSPAIPPVPLKEDWAIFNDQIPARSDITKIAATTLVKFDTIHQVIFSGDAGSRGLFRWNSALNSSLLQTLPSPAVDLYLGNDGTGVITSIGTLISKNLNQANGAVFSFNPEHNGENVRMIADGLPRPVKAVPGDFNRDGLEDWIVCAFGHDFGGLYLYRQTREHSYSKVVVSELPGAEQAIVGDFNNDGWPDVMALFAQAREGIWMFLNNKKGGFSEKNLLEFPPVYGSTSFQLIDFNGDGKKDILYTAGDNADFSNIYKPYHGVYIFLNKGDFQFDIKPTYFYPVNGCTKAVAADFDKDGDIDIVSIAFFADFKRKPSESFIYFEQDRPLHFIPHSVPISKYGRWISMDVGDFNGDGLQDVVLGNFSQGFGSADTSKGVWDKHIPLIVLKNTAHR